MDLTPQSITSETVRGVQFREKLRGYHPDDVDAFVAAVAGAVEALEQRAKQAESKLIELESRSSAVDEAEDSLRRTLVLAQRTADAAIQEAREEADRVRAQTRAERESAEAELADLRARLQAEIEEESRLEAARLLAERTALQRDVAALDAHLERERERLRIYFTDQLRRVVEGEPGVGVSPEMEAQVAAPEEPPVAVAVEASEPVVDEVAEEPTEAVVVEAGTDDDPFLAELRRAVTDEAPLGPRDHEVAAPDSGDENDDAFDLFARGDDDAGRFGSRFRRK